VNDDDDDVEDEEDGGCGMKSAGGGVGSGDVIEGKVTESWSEGRLQELTELEKVEC
jgi:hypothetical protein